MGGVLADTGPLVALFSARDTYHAVALDWFRTYRGQLITTWPVLTEVSHLLGHAHLVRAFMIWVSRGGVQVFEAPGEASPAIAELMLKYERPQIDLADATLFWMADELNVDEIISIDFKGIATYRTPRGKSLANVFPTGGRPAGRRRKLHSRA